MNLRILFLFLLVIPLSWLSHANDHRGVYFKSKEVSLENRTGLDLTSKNTISYSNNFSIDFEISFRDIEQRYGYILQLKETKENHQFDLIYNIDGRFPDLFIVLDKKETQLQLGLTDEQIHNVNRWYSFNLTVNAETGDVAMTFAGKTVYDKINLPKSSRLQWVFGIVNRYGFEIDEVAPMSIRNIKFSEQNKLKYFWPLAYTSKSSVKDSIRGKSAFISNPAWVIDRHRNWQKVATFRFDEFPQVAFNRNAEEISFVQRRKGITRYNLNTRKVRDISYKNGNPFYEDAQQVFFDKNDKLRTYSKYKQLVPQFDESTLTWDNSFDTLAYLPKYWHHNSLLHPVDSSFIAIGGYGFFTYYNTFRKLNDEIKQWEDIPFKGSMFEPRYLAALGQSLIDRNVYYYFGGLGNESGKQILGKEFYHDLYKIDFEANYITKLWDLSDLQEESITPVNSMVVNDLNDCFYTLCFKHGSNNTELQLFKASISSGEHRFIGSKIPYVFHDITSFADLYHWESHNKLLALTVHKSDNGRYEVNIYDLNYPPSEIDPVELSNSNNGKFINLYIAFFILLLSGVLALIFLRNRRKPANKKLSEIKVPETTDTSVGEYKQGRIHTFGGFQVIDKNGKDITYRFSPTLKELFLLILLNTIEDNKGISSNKIKELLWPDKPDHKAKNNRGVNIKKLRLILEDVGNINISFDGNSWRINHSEEVFCDIGFLRNYFSKVTDVTNLEGFEKVVAVLQRGNFLLDTESEWLDKVKDDISGRILTRLEEVCAVLNLRKHESLLLLIADIMFTFDPMNETALKNKCSILNHQGKHSLALEVYNHYIKLYQKLYNENFEKTFKDLIS